MLSGALSAFVVLLFRAFVDQGQIWLLADGVGAFEELSPYLRLLFPLVAGLALGWVFDRLPRDVRRVGVIHVMSRLNTPGAERLRWRNLLAQFFGGVVAIGSGHSVDKEGPTVHLGAAAANLAGQRLKASADEDRTMAACGAAAAIAAAFNTPLAGVIFVIEVIGVRYEVSRFLPVIMASVVGTVMNRTLFYGEPVFDVPSIPLSSDWELGLMMLLGLSTGLLATLFVALTEKIAGRVRSWPNLLTFALAGLVTGVLALGRRRSWTPAMTRWSGCSREKAPWAWCWRWC